MDRVEWRAPQHAMAIDISTVPSPEHVTAAVECVADMGGDASRYAVLFALVGSAGMRPSEAVSLNVEDLNLPLRGWGDAIVRGAITAPGPMFTTTGSGIEAKGLKHRAPGSVRHVPLSPAVVASVQGHLAAFPPIDGRLLSNAAGSPVTAANYWPVWKRARSRLWPKGSRLAATTVYELRHAAATMMLRAGVTPAEVARRLGHSVDVLLRVYAGVFEDERDRSNELIDIALREAVGAT
jgi:integrase